MTPPDLQAEVARFFDDSSLASGSDPRFVLLLGGTGSGKSRLRKERYSTGFVLLDAGAIFMNLGGEDYDFDDERFQEPMNQVGLRVAERAITERRNIVTEMTGHLYEDTKSVIDAMLSAGYKVENVFVECDVVKAWDQNLARGNDNISSYYAQPFHQRWLLDAVNKCAVEHPEKSG